MLDIDAILKDFPNAVPVWDKWDKEKEDMDDATLEASLSLESPDYEPELYILEVDIIQHHLDDGPSERAVVYVAFESPLIFDDGNKYGCEIISTSLIPWLEYDPVRTEKALDDLINQGVIIFNRKNFVRLFGLSLREYLQKEQVKREKAAEAAKADAE